MRRAALAIGVVVLVGCGGAVVEDNGVDAVGQTGEELRPADPTGDRIGTYGCTENRTHRKIEYHGGAVVAGAVNVYFIWYGDWSTKPQTQLIMADFASHLGGSSYFQINTKYTDASGQAPSGQVFYGGAAADSGSQGTSLTNAAVPAIVSGRIAAGALPLDTAGVYVVLGAKDVKIPGLCQTTCGQHNVSSHNGTPFRYIFVGDTARCPNACTAQGVGPNGDSADGMANLLAAELSNTVSDPELTAWYDRHGFENADKCAWTFGHTYKAPNGRWANVKLGTRDYLLQRNWYPTARGGACVLSVSQGQSAVAAGQDIVSE